MKYYNETFVYNNFIPIQVKHLNNFDFVPHWHMDVEIVLVLQGKIRIGVNSNHELLSAGDMVVIGSGDIHYFDSLGLASSIASLIFSPELLDSKTGWPKNGQLQYPFLKKKDFQEESLEHLANSFQSVVTEEREKKPMCDMIIKAKLLEMSGLILRCIPIVDNKEESKAGYAVKNRRMKGILTYIEENFSLDLSIESIAEKFDISPFYLSKIFHSVTGMNFRRYINFIRVSEANYLLTNSDKSITDIANECGFNSIRTFNRAFKEIKGYTPSNLR